MKLSTILKKKKTLTMVGGGLVLVGLAGGGVYLAENKSKQMTDNPKNTQKQTAQDPAESPKNTGTINNSNPVSTPDNTQSGTTTTPAPAPSQNLNDVSIQGTLDAEGNILTSVYGDGGTYTVEKKSGSSWIDVLTNAAYSGVGGLDLKDNIPVSELSRTYRVYRTVNGQKVGPKEITVDRNLVRNNGSASFPEAQ